MVVDRPAIFFANGIGDSLLALPSIRAIAAHARGRATLIGARGPTAAFFADIPLERRVFVRFHSLPDCKEFDVDMVESAVTDCDIFISLVPWRSASLAVLIGRLHRRETKTIGFEGTGPFAIEVPYDFGSHSADALFGMARFVAQVRSLAAWSNAPPLLKAAARRCDRLLGPIQNLSDLLVVHAGRGGHKDWRPERYRQVATEFIARNSSRCACIFAATDDERFAESFPERTVLVRGQPVAVAIALCQRASVVLGPDSYVLHAADLLRRPIVGLFGPTSPDVWGARFTRGIHLKAPIDVGDISVEEVTAALEEVMRKEDPVHNGTVTSRGRRITTSWARAIHRPMGKRIVRMATASKKPNLSRARNKSDSRVRVKLLLKGGHKHITSLGLDDPLLKSLLSAVAEAEKSRDLLFNIAGIGTQHCLLVRAAEIIGIEMTPAIVVESARSERSSAADRNVGPRWIQVPEFIAPSRVNELLNAVISRESLFEKSTVASGKETWRKSRYIAEGLPEVAERVRDKVRAYAYRAMTSLGMQPFAVGKVDCQITAHGEGDYYRRHVDKGSGSSATRKISYVYYFAREPCPFRGGLLKLFSSSTLQSGQISETTSVEIEPICNTMVFFPSDCPHEVSKVDCASGQFSDSRFTINGWIHVASE